MSNKLSNLIQSVFLGKAIDEKEAKPDLRNDFVRVAVPDEHEHLPDEPAPPELGPRLAAPGFHVPAPGETARD